MRRISIDPNHLRKLIEDDELPQHEVARLLGVSRDTVVRRCRELGLKTQRTGPRSGPKHPDWKGGQKIVGGYRYIYRPDHPNATKQRYVLEHRLAMESHLGRYLLPSEVVHHINGDRLDNRIENLAVFSSNAEHLKEELAGRIPNWTPEGLERMKEGLTRSAKTRGIELCGPLRIRTTPRKKAKPGTKSRRASE